MGRREIVGLTMGSTIWGSSLAHAATLEEANNRLQILEAQMAQLYKEEELLEAQIESARAARAVAIAVKSGSKPLVPEVLELYPENWEEYIGQARPTFVEFYAPWCPYCKRLEPIWKDLAKDLAAKNSNVQIARLNADTYTEFMPRYDVRGFPTLVLFEAGRPSKVYNGRAELDALKKFAATA